MMPKMGHPLPRLGLEMGARENGDGLAMISQDFDDNRGQSTCLQIDPFLLANRA